MAWLGNRLAYPIGMPLLTIFSTVTTFIAPRVLGPAAFGSYTLLLTIYLLAGRSDLGLTQLGDRRLAHARAGTTESADPLLGLRSRIALAVVAILLPLTVLDGLVRARYAPMDAALAVLAGVGAMVAAGPATIFRAQRRTREFTGLAFLLHFGLTLPRLAGLVLAGSAGCFAVLAAWNGTIAFAGRRRRRMIAPVAPVWPTLRASLPLFAFTSSWTLYMIAGRWISGLVTAPHRFGLFAFGLSLAFVGVNTVAAISDVRYPHWLARLSDAPRGACSAAVARETALVAVACAMAIAVLVPFAAPLTTALFPAYLAAVPAVVVLAIGSLPLVTVGWLLPIAVARTETPVRHAAVLFMPSVAVLAGATILGERYGGIVGQAWGNGLAAFALLGTAMWLMSRLGILRPGAALGLVMLNAALAIGLSLLAPGASAAPMPPADWQVVFDERFSTLDLWDGVSGRWQAHYPWGARTNTGELEYYVDPQTLEDGLSRDGFDPFDVRRGHLAIIARPVPPAARRATHGLPYVSGLLTTAPSFAFTYGYFEMIAEVPAGRGLWPAFWLLPKRLAWPPEIDVMEVLGDDTRHYWATSHSVGASGRQIETQTRIDTMDLSSGAHAYGLLWTPQTINWFFDGRCVAQMPTPADAHEPMYLLLNLAVGGTWAGPPDPSTPFPATMYVHRVRVLQPRDGARSPEGCS